MSGRARCSVHGYWSFFCACLFVFACPLYAVAQVVVPSRAVFQPPPASQWEVSFYGGSLGGGIPMQGTSELPESQPLVGTVNGKLMRNQPSWFFAWGADYFQQLATQAQIPQRIATLDEVVFLPSSDRARAWAAGGRVSRVLNPRASIEASVEFSRAPVRLTDTARSAVEAARASFPVAWNALLAQDTATFQNVDVSATSTIADGSMSQMSADGAVIINILTRRRNTPYVGLGAGVMMNTGTSPTATLTGRTRMRLNGTSPIDETDTMTLGYALDRTVVAVSIHLGIKRMMGERWGIRGEMREQLSSNPLTHVVSTSPSRVLATAPAEQGVAATPAFVAVQFSNIGTTSSTLSGDLADFRTFGGTGMESRLSFTGGIFWRF